MSLSTISGQSVLSSSSGFGPLAAVLRHLCVKLTHWLVSLRRAGCWVRCPRRQALFFRRRSLDTLYHETHPLIRLLHFGHLVCIIGSVFQCSPDTSYTLLGSCCPFWCLSVRPLAPFIESPLGPGSALCCWCAAALGRFPLSGCSSLAFALTSVISSGVFSVVSLFSRYNSP